MERRKLHDPTWFGLTREFDDILVKGVIIFPEVVFHSHDAWESDIVNRAIPAMGKKYREMFLDCGADLWLFFFFIDHVYDWEW